MFDDEKKVLGFFIGCVASVIIVITVSITAYNMNVSEKNNPQLACIKEHGNWQSFGQNCTFDIGK